MVIIKNVKDTLLYSFCDTTEDTLEAVKSYMTQQLAQAEDVDLIA